jgi:hypothetical protein
MLNTLGLTAFDAAPTRPAAQADPRAPGTRLRQSRPSPRRTTAQQRRSRALHHEVRGHRPVGRHSPPVRAAILVEPGGDLRVSLAETRWRNGDPDKDREAPFGDCDHLAWVAGHSVPFERGPTPKFRATVSTTRNAGCNLFISALSTFTLSGSRMLIGFSRKKRIEPEKREKLSNCPVALCLLKVTRGDALTVPPQLSACPA